MCIRFRTRTLRREEPIGQRLMKSEDTKEQEHHPATDLQEDRST